MARVRIVKKPTAKTGLEVKMQPGLYGTNGNRQFSLPTQIDSQKYSEPDTEVRNTLQPVPRDQANLEAEKGETAVLNMGGFPAHFTIGGQRHSQGGTPLNLPDDSFIFSDTAKMKIKDPAILAQFGMSLKKGGYTPADIAKKYNINKFRKILADGGTDDLQRSTAEMMIANYNEKLAKLALAQESKKGFPQGIPAIAQPYLQAHNIDPAQYLPTQGQQDNPNANMGVARYGANVVSNWQKAYGGVQYRDGLPMGQHGFDPTTLSGWGAGLLNVLEAPQRAMMYVGTGLFGDREHEVVNPKTGEVKWVSEKNLPLFTKPNAAGEVWQKTGQTAKAHYEMPGETLKRTHPQSSPWLQGAADIFADPFLISGLAKTGARLATKKLIKETADAVATGSMRGLTKEEMVNQIIKNAGKTGTQKEVNIVAKSLDAGAEALLKSQGKGAVKQAKAVEKAVAKAAGKARQVEDIKVVGKKIGEAGEVIYEKGIKPIGKGIQTAAKKAKELGVEAAEAVAGPYVGPVALPVAKNIPGAVKSAMYKDEAEEAKKKLAVAEKKLEQQAQNRYVPTTPHPSGAGLFTNPTKPGKTFYFDKGQYMELTPEVSDTLGMAAGMPKQNGGILEYQGGGGVTNTKGTFTYYGDGSVWNSAANNGKGKWVKQADPNWKPAAEAKPQGDIKLIKGTKVKAGLPGGANTKTVIGRTATGEAIYDYGTRTKPPYDIKQAFDKAGIDRLNIMRGQYGLPPVEYGNPSDPSYQAKIKAAAGEMQQAGIGQNPELVYDYMRTKNPKPNAKLEQLLQSKGYGKTNKDLQKAIDEGKITPDEVRNAYKDDQWWFRGVTTQKKQLPREEYERKMKQEGLIKQGEKSFFAEDPDQPWLYTEYEPFDPEKPAPQVTIKPGEKQPDAKREPFVSPGLKPVKANMNAPWWLQDIIGTAGAWGDMARIKRHQPWQATPQTFLPQATFYDPTRELAANAEQANIASQFHQAFTGPKSGQISENQGKAMGIAADTLGRYNNMNVNVANQLEQQRAQIMNQASQNRAGLATNLHDAYTRGDQDFENSMAKAREQVRKHAIAAVTNRAKTQALNSLFPNYYTDPSTGGMLGFHPDFTKIPATQQDFSDPYLKALKLTRDPDRALRYMELQSKGSMSNPYDERRGYLGAQGYGNEG